MAVVPRPPDDNIRPLVGTVGRRVAVVEAGQRIEMQRGEELVEGTARKAPVPKVAGWLAILLAHGIENRTVCIKCEGWHIRIDDHQPRIEFQQDQDGRRRDIPLGRDPAVLPTGP